jgi:hypothetical protein
MQAVDPQLSRTDRPTMSINQAQFRRVFFRESAVNRNPPQVNTRKNIILCVFTLSILNDNL